MAHIIDGKLVSAITKEKIKNQVEAYCKEYKTGEKRIYAPTVIFVRDGKVLGLHVSTVDSQKSGFDKMTEDQIEQLYGIYEDSYEYLEFLGYKCLCKRYVIKN